MPIGRPPIPIMLSEGEREELESMTRLVLKSLRIGDFTAFKAADLTFVTGLNVIIGANGAGKSHLLKLPSWP